jgi:hypothetical protein
MSNHTKLEKDFTKKVRYFMQKTGTTLGKIGGSPEVQYSNTKKLTEFFIEERGTISMAVAGRIENFIKRKP